jgi:hypothetical protein
MKPKRITIPISGGLDSIRAQLHEELGIEMSYHQVVDYLAKFYRKNNKPVTIPPVTTWRK